MKKLISVIVAYSLTIVFGLCAFADEPIVDTSHVYMYQEMVDDMKALSEKYPTVSYSEVGKSASGQPIYEITLGNPNASHNVFIVSSLHASEYQNTLLMMDLIEDAAPNYTADVCYYIIPMANPDGIFISQSGQYPKWKANGIGIDINRNFPAGFGNNSSSAPGYAFYAGPAPFSATEAVAVNNLLTARKYDCAISYHQQGQIIIYASYPCTPDVTYRGLCLVQGLSAMTGYKPTLDAAPNGGMAEYANTMLNIPTVTIETGTKSPNPVSAYPKVYKQNKNLFAIVNNIVSAW